MTIQLTTEQKVSLIQSAWQQVMPNSLCTARTAMSSTHVKFYIGAGKHEWSNGISNNDHLDMVAWIEDNNLVEGCLSLLVKPTTPNMVYGSVKLRKASTALTTEALVKRFTKVRAFIMSEYNLDNDLYDICKK